MNTYILQTRHGLAIVVAENETDALEELKVYEVDEYLSFGAEPGDFQELNSNETGVIVYTAG